MLLLLWSHNPGGVPSPPQVGGGRGIHPGWDEERWRRKKKFDRAVEEDVRAIYRRLREVPEIRDEAAQIVAPILRPTRRNRPAVNWSMVSAEIEIALRKLDLRRQQIILAEDEAAVLIMMLAS